MFKTNEYGVVENPNEHIIFKGKDDFLGVRLNTACNSSNEWFGAICIRTNNWGNSSGVSFKWEHFSSEDQCIEYYMKKIKELILEHKQDNPERSTEMNKILEAIDNFCRTRNQMELF